MTTAETVPFFDVRDTSFSIRSAEVMAAREQSWYARTPYGIAVLRYPEVNALLRHPLVRQGSWAWPSHNGIYEGELARWWATWLLNIEGEAHHRLRRLLNPAFSPKHINAMVPGFQILAGELIDAFIDRGECEFMAEFAEPYAARVITRLLGFPEDNWQEIADDSATIGLAMGVTIAEDLPRIEAALLRLFSYCDAMIAERIAEPRDDFASGLVAAHLAEDGLTYDELRDSLALMVFGGFDTTRNQLSLAMKTFAEYPDQWDLLAARPELGRAAVEEVMRVNPTVTWVTREAVEDFEFNGLEISAGTTLHLFSVPAGTDPDVYDPVAVDLTVTGRKPHAGFGAGTHHCIGHFIARADMTEALALMASRMADLAIAEGAEYLPDSGNTGAIRLPLTFRRRS
jgi:cytochrome P450